MKTMNRTAVRNPMMRDIVQMANAFDRAFGSPSYNYAANGGSSNGNTAVRTMNLPINAWVDGDTYMIKAFLPGINPEDVDISFEKDTLTIKGEFASDIAPNVVSDEATEKGKEEAGEEVEYIRHELFSGAFQRSLSFRVPVNADAIEANFDNGVLTLSVPKAEEAKPKQIKVMAR